MSLGIRDTPVTDKPLMAVQTESDEKRCVPPQPSVHVSVVVPVYRGASYLREVVNELEELRKEWMGSGSPLSLTEVIFVDDASVDESLDILLELKHERDWVRVLQLSRNFGQHPATVAGILHSCGDWVCTIDEDMQHPPRYLPALITKAVLKSSDVVYARPEEAVHESVFRDLSSRSFKTLISRVSGNPHTRLFNSFRVIRGTVARAAAAVSAAETYFDIALCWFTNRITSHPLPLKDGRHIKDRQSSYNLLSLLAHARRMFVSSGVKVLRPAALIGFMALFGSIFFGVGALLCKLLFPQFVHAQGWTSLAILVVFFGGLSSFMLGVALEYMSVILLKTQGRPTFLVIDRSQDHPLKEWMEQRKSP